MPVQLVLGKELRADPIGTVPSVKFSVSRSPTACRLVAVPSLNKVLQKSHGVQVCVITVASVHILYITGS